MRCSVWEYWVRAIVARVCSMRQDLWLAPKAGHRKKWFYPSTYVESGRNWARMARVVEAERQPVPAPVRVPFVPPTVIWPTGVMTPAETIGSRAIRVHFGDPTITAEIARFYDEEAARVA